jgi:glutathione synthase/RimK-type ligase-like ATP-grasp enzyme
MPNFLLYSDGTATTGRALGRYLRIGHGRNIPAARQGTRLDYLIRWGSSTRVARRPRNVINNRQAILAVTDKYESLLRFAEQQIPVPRTLPLTNANIRGIQYPALARRRQHQGGTDIILCLQAGDATRALRAGREFLVEYIPTHTEYRFHVFNGEVIKTSEKVLTAEEPGREHRWVRNLANGYTFRQVRTPPSVTARNTALHAVEVSGLNFGAVDVIVSDRGRPFVLEINTGPGLVASSLRTYGEIFGRILGVTNFNTAVLEELETDGDE